MGKLICKKCGSLSHRTESVVFKDLTRHIAATCSDCGAFIRYLPQGPFKFYYGKHKGKEIKDVPEEYLRWCIENKTQGWKRIQDYMALKTPANGPRTS